MLVYYGKKIKNKLWDTKLENTVCLTTNCRNKITSNVKKKKKKRTLARYWIGLFLLEYLCIVLLLWYNYVKLQTIKVMQSYSGSDFL